MPWQDMARHLAQCFWNSAVQIGAMEWYNSTQYQEALRIRLRSAKTRAIMLAGHWG